MSDTSGTAARTPRAVDVSQCREAVEVLRQTRTLPTFVAGLVAAHGDNPAIDVEGEVLTYRQLDVRSRQLARGLLARGIGKGSRVALIFANGAEFAIAMSSVTRIGAVAVPLSTLFKPPELARVLRHGDIQAVLAQRGYAGQDFAANLVAALPFLSTSRAYPLCSPQVPFLRWIAFLDQSPGPPWAHDLSWLHPCGSEGFSDEVLEAAQAEVHPDEPALMVYTSGQSAEPKGVVHSHGGVMRKTHYLREVFGFDATSSVPAGLPFFWVGGMVMSLLPVLDAGGTVTCRRSPTKSAPKLGALGKSRPDFRARGARMELLVGLGMTETFGPYSWGREMPDADRPLCPPLIEFEPGYDIKVVDADNATVLDGGCGEIALRGPTLMTGLYKVHKQSTFDAEGFYRTGDRAELDGDRLYFVGRIGDMIKVSGANVAPAEVERELLAIDGIAAAHVVGVDDAERGQVVAAAIVPAPHSSIEPRDIVEQLAQRLSPYKVPKLMAIVAAHDLPTLPTGKIAKRELAAMLRRRGSTVTPSSRH